jgi:hypothetical protein
LIPEARKSPRLALNFIRSRPEQGRPQRVVTPKTRTETPRVVEGRKNAGAYQVIILPGGPNGGAPRVQATTHHRPARLSVLSSVQTSLTSVIQSGDKTRRARMCKTIVDLVKDRACLQNMCHSMLVQE